jgi:hypothetical protein
MTEHPTPWRVVYFRPPTWPDWHEKAIPYIVDANSEQVILIPHKGKHPSEYDALGDHTAHQIVNAVNEQARRRQLAKQVLENALNPTVKTPRKPVIND